MTWVCWFRHRWAPWMLFGQGDLEVRSCWRCSKLQWRGGDPPWELLRPPTEEGPESR